MTLLASWSETLLATIGREALLATLFFLAVIPLARLVRGRVPVLVHSLWALVLLRLVLPVGWAAPWSARSLLAPLLSWVPAWGRLILGVEVADPVGEAVAAVFQPEAVMEPTASGASPSAVWLLFLAVTWLAGVAISHGIWWRRRRRYVRLLQASQSVTEAGLLSTLDRWRRRLGVRRSVRLVCAEAAVTPFTLGVLRPVIFLPAALLARGDSALLEAVVAHELAHVRRLDALWLALQHEVCSLYFFHPVAWIASSRLIETRERLCDRLVLAAGTLSPRAYGRSLLAVVSLSARPENSAVAAFVTHSKHSTQRAKRRLAMRLTDLLHPTVTSRPRVSLSRAAALLLALFLLPMAGGVHADDDGQSVVATPAIPANLFTVALLSAAPSTGSLVHPLPSRGRVTSPFGERKNPLSGKLGFHRGVDFKAATGATVVAAGDGVVEAATTRYQSDTSWGTIVIVDHGNGIKTFYSHLDSLSVTAGQRVRAGDTIGGAGSTGKVTGPHLHFEVWQEGTPVDPFDYIAGGC